MRLVTLMLGCLGILALAAVGIFSIQHNDPIAVSEREATAAIRVQTARTLAALSVEQAERSARTQPSPPVLDGSMVVALAGLTLLVAAVWAWIQFGCYLHMYARRKVGLVSTDDAGRLPVTIETVTRTDFPQESIKAYHATRLAEAQRPILLPPAYMRYQVTHEQSSAPALPAAPVLDVLMQADAVALYGSRGSGKTTLLQNWIHGLLAAGYRVTVADPHSYPGKWPGEVEVLGAGRDFASILRGVDTLAGEMHRRSALLSSGRATEDDFAKDGHFWLFDEFSAAMNETDKELETAVTRKIRSCIMESRKFGLFPCFTVQSKNARFLGVSGAADLKAGLLFVRLDKDASGARRCYVSKGDTPETEAQLPPPAPRRALSDMDARPLTARYEVVTEPILDTLDTCSPTPTPTTTPDMHVLAAHVGAETEGVGVVGVVGVGRMHQSPPADPREGQARAMLLSGASLTATATAVYGNAAGSAFRKVQAIKKRMDAEPQ
jgi:energy-coupling factor transporter ATP-binding protein EcfA2